MTENANPGQGSHAAAPLPADTAGAEGQSRTEAVKQQADAAKEPAETAAGASGSADAGAGAVDNAGADSGDAEPTIDNFAEISGPDRRTEEDKLPPVPGADGGATEPHPGGSPV